MHSLLRYRLIELVSSWQLATLTAAAFALSIASLYTTLIGIDRLIANKFFATLASFGIQGIMLITAWLIGESFAERAHETQGRAGRLVAKGLRRLSVFMLALTIAGIGGLSFYEWWTTDTNQRVADTKTLLWYGIGGLAVLAICLGLVTRDITQAYAASVQTILREIVLWSMFLICMGCSIFFSFESHFISVFPDDERKRDGDSEAVGRMSLFASELRGAIDKTIREESDKLFRSNGWRTLEKDHLTILVQISTEERRAIETKIEGDRAALQQLIREADAAIARAALAKVELEARAVEAAQAVTKIELQLVGLKDELDVAKAKVEQLKREIAKKSVEATAEERGFEGSLKIGKGTQYKARKDEEDALRGHLEIAERRLANARNAFDQKERELIEARATQRRAVAALAEHNATVSKVEADKARAQRIMPRSLGDDIGGSIIEQAKGAFRQALAPASVASNFGAENGTLTTDRALQQLVATCVSLRSSIAEIGDAKLAAKVQPIACDADQLLKDSASQIGQLQGRRAEFERIANEFKGMTMDEVFGQARALLQIANIGINAADMRSKLHEWERERSDMSNTFVTSWNAFRKGNKLAQLALALAITFDVLVFFAAVRGARIIQNPLDAIGLRHTGAEVERYDPEHLRAAIQAIDLFAPPLPGFEPGTFAGGVSADNMNIDPIVGDVFKLGSGATFMHRDRQGVVTGPYAIICPANNRGRDYAYIHSAFYATMQGRVARAVRAGRIPKTAHRASGGGAPTPAWRLGGTTDRQPPHQAQQRPRRRWFGR